MAVIIPGQSAARNDSAAGSFVIEGSASFNQGDTQYLSRTFGVNKSNYQKTFSFWVKKTDYADTQCIFSTDVDGYVEGRIGFLSSDILQITDRDSSSGSTDADLQTNRVFRDSGWYHIVFAYDTPNATGGDRMKLYVNGVEQTSFGSDTNPAQTYAVSLFRSSALNYIACNDTGDPLGAHLSQIHFIDGQVLDPSYFGYTDELTGVWRPKEFSGNYNVMVNGATGAKPILLTSGGPYGGSSTTGSVDTTDSAKASLVIALPLQDDTTDVSNLVRGSGSAISVTAVDAKYTSSYSQYYGASGDFTDSTDKFSMQVSNSGGEFDIGTGNCCIEWWAYYPSTVGSNGYIFRSDTTNGVECYAYAHSNGTVAVKFGTFTWDAWPGSGGNHDDWSNGVWNHFCIERNSSTWTAYMNGVPVRTTSGSASANPGDTMGIGNYNNSNLTYYAKCYLQDFRWYTASKYGGNSFTVPGLGTNSFYLPLDGNTLIGEDRSGKGNNWTPVNIGSTNVIDKATGALPILNTLNGGTTATVGVRTDSNSTNLVLAVPMVGIASDKSQQINSGTSAKTLTNTTVEFKSLTGNFYGNSGDFTGAATDCINTADSDDFKMEEGDFTVECWVYSTSTSGTQNICQILGDSSSKYYGIYYSSSALKFYITGSGGAGEVSAGDVVMGKDKWFHLALTRTGGKMRGFVDGVKLVEASDSCDIDESGYQAYIGRHGPTTNGFEGYIQDFRIYKGVAKYTKNFIVATPANPVFTSESPAPVSYSSNLLGPTAGGAVSFDGTGDYLTIGDGSTADLEFGTGDYTVEMWVYPAKLTSNRCFFDTRNTTGGGPVNGFSIVSNGDGLCSTYCGGYVIQSKDYLANYKWTHVEVTRTGGNEYLFLDGKLQGVAATSRTYDYGRVRIGADAAGPSEVWQGMISNLRMIKGTCRHTADFIPPTEPLTSITNTKVLCCQSNSSTTAYITSPTAITATGNVAAFPHNPFDNNIRNVKGLETLYPTFDPQGSRGALSENNLRWTTTDGNDNYGALITPGFSSGKYYVEFEVLNVGAATVAGVTQGAIAGAFPVANAWPGFTSGYGIGFSFQVNQYYYGGSNQGAIPGNVFDAAAAVGDIVMIACDADQKIAAVGKNGMWSAGTLAASYLAIDSATMEPPFYFATGDSSASHPCDLRFNSGQKPFRYSPPEGFQPLTAANSPRPTVPNPTAYVGVSTYSGTGSQKAVTFDFQPDLMWVKRRDSGQYNILTDSISGASNYFATNEQDQLSVGGGSQLINKFVDNGFEVGTENAVNNNGGSYVAFGWKAGGRKGSTWNLNGRDAGSAAAAGLTAGDTAKLTAATINTTAGFSIIKWTQDSGGAGSDIAHGLTKAPTFVLMKHVNASSHWFVHHSTIAATKILYLNSNDDEDTSSDFGDTDPSATIVKTSTTGVNGRVVMLYCWHDVEGLQKFGSYTGNGSTTGPMVFLGFRPAILLIKKYAGGNDSWEMWADPMSPTRANPTSDTICPNTGNAAQQTGRNVDFYANGFQMRNSNGTSNESSSYKYVYAAWAAAPWHDLYGAQANSR